MMARMKIPIFVGVAVLAIAWLVATGVTRNDLYMSTLDEWSPDRARRESVRVMGFVADGSINEDATRLITHFTLRNDTADRTIAVRYDGVLPDLFRDGASIIASGRLGTDDVFVAADLMTKCPSKYEGMDVPHGEAGPESTDQTDSAPVPATSSLR